MRAAGQKTSSQFSATAQRASSPCAEPSQLDPLLGLQQTAGNQAVLRLLRAGHGNAKFQNSSAQAPLLRSADAALQHAPRSRVGLRLQRKCAACAVGAPCSECEDEDREKKIRRQPTRPMIQRAAREGDAGSSAAAQPQSPTEPAKAGPSLIVEDNTQELKSGQMRKGEFLSQLRTAVCATAEQALAGTMWSAMGCPYIERWLGHYSKQPSAYLERALRKYAPETAGAGSAHDYIPLVQQRLRRGIEQWRTTGEIPEAPKELGDVEMTGATVSGLVGGLLSGAGRAISGFVGGLLPGASNAVAGLANGTGRALTNASNVLFKHQEGQESEPADPLAVRAQLGNGGALDGRVRSRMQSAFGTDFSSVRVHTDATAQALNESLSARAFTIGTDIAFGAGEYRPGTLVGDALIAHELAHVVQQGAASGSSGVMQMGNAEPSSLEEDADLSAVGAMVSLWGGTVGNLKAAGRSARPSVRAGLKLQRCAGKQTPTPKPVKPAAPPGSTTTPTGPTGGGNLPPIVEELGSTRCDVDQQKMIFELKTERIPTCMVECATVHELAHVKYGTEACAKVSTAYQKVTDAIKKVETSKSESDLNEADNAAKEFEKAVAEYEKWHDANCRENERQAYQAGLDACKGAEIEKRCAETGKGGDYKRIMKEWEDFKKNPPNCK